MKSQTHPPLWIVIGVPLLWIGLAANVAYDYIYDQRITPFSILFFLALLAGILLPKIFKWPVYTSQPSRAALISMVILFIILIAYVLIRIAIS